MYRIITDLNDPHVEKEEFATVAEAEAWIKEDSRELLCNHTDEIPFSEESAQNWGYTSLIVKIAKAVKAVPVVPEVQVVLQEVDV